MKRPDAAPEARFKQWRVHGHTVEHLEPPRCRFSFEVDRHGLFWCTQVECVEPDDQTSVEVLNRLASEAREVLKHNGQGRASA